MSRATARRLGQLAIVAGVLWLLARKLDGQWAELRRAVSAARPAWPLVAIAACAVLAVYAVQIHAWRTLVGVWGARLPFWRAARVWTVSNLSRFAPASVLVTTGVIGALGSRAGVPAAAAAGSAILGTLLNLGTGAILVVALGGGLLHRLVPAIPSAVSIALAAAGGAALLALPLLVPPAVSLASRILKRPVTIPPVSAYALATAVTANVVAWLLYGAAHALLIRAFFPGAGGGWVPTTAVFTGAYVAGWLAILVPGGLGVRESFLTLGLTSLGMLTAPDALVIAVASRILLTILEVLPGAAFLARDALARSSSLPDGSR